jgi:hypothetical protein
MVPPASDRIGCHRAAGSILPAEQPGWSVVRTKELCAWGDELTPTDGIACRRKPNFVQI